MMGLEEHLLTMFREDFEFGDGRAPSHLGGHATASREDTSSAATAPVVGPAPTVAPAPAPVATRTESRVTAGEGGPVTWTVEAEKELKKIPFFVRGKASRNTEKYARERGVATITLETLYEAKAHFRS
jgi:light-independent protochlorophyllide reductase subunit B